MNKHQIENLGDRITFGKAVLNPMSEGEALNTTEQVKVSNNNTV